MNFVYLVTLEDHQNNHPIVMKLKIHIWHNKQRLYLFFFVDKTKLMGCSWNLVRFYFTVSCRFFVCSGTSSCRACLYLFSLLSAVWFSLISWWFSFGVFWVSWIVEFILTLSWRRSLYIETSPLICGANQWNGFYMITASVMKELNLKIWWMSRWYVKRKNVEVVK